MRLQDALLLDDGGSSAWWAPAQDEPHVPAGAGALRARSKGPHDHHDADLCADPEQSPGCILAVRSDDILERAAAMLKKHRHITAAAGESAEAGS